jgi:hypothetical protein
MRRVIKWVFVYAHKALLGPDGQVVRNTGGEPVLVRDRFREFRVNWPVTCVTPELWSR